MASSSVQALYGLGDDLATDDKDKLWLRKLWLLWLLLFDSVLRKFILESLRDGNI